MVVIARFGDTRRAARMRAWLRRSHISSRLYEGMDGRMELAVHARDESRALDLLVTLFWGLSIDHMRPEPAMQRAMTLENALLAGALGLITAMLGLVAWWTIPVLAAVSAQFILVIVLAVVVVVAFHPGPGKARAHIPGEGRRVSPDRVRARLIGG